MVWDVSRSAGCALGVKLGLRSPTKFGTKLPGLDVWTPPRPALGEVEEEIGLPTDLADRIVTFEPMIRSHVTGVRRMRVPSMASSADVYSHNGVHRSLMIAN